LGGKAKIQGELVPIDTLFVNVRPGKPVKHFTAYDPVAKWTIGRVSAEASAISAKSSLDMLLREAPFPIRGIPVDGGASTPSSKPECQARGLELFVLPPKRHDLNGGVERALGATSSTPPTTWRAESTSSRPSSTPSPIDSTTIGRKPQQSISKLSAKAIHRRLMSPGISLTTEQILFSNPALAVAML
jgi:hypothetical protein